jgi:arsenate reductase-like glutaredoxin family protein
MIIYGLTTCDTCRKASKALEDITFVDIRADGFPAGVLERAAETFGADLVNRRSATWRGLSEEERALPVIELIRRHPAVMKRPLIQTDAGLHLGWGPEVRQALDV